MAEWLERSVSVGRRTHGFRLRIPSGRTGRRGGLPPAILFLHGRGESGRDNARQVQVGLPPAIDRDPKAWPFVVVVPQKPSYDRLWPKETRLLEAVLAAVDAEVETDPERRYLTGLSQGGNGTFTLATSLPWRFAAIAPVCGWADPMRTARELGDLPVWAFHGLADGIVPASCSQAVADCMARWGRRPKLTLYPGVEHNSWDQAYGPDGSGPEAWPRGSWHTGPPAWARPLRTHKPGPDDDPDAPAPRPRAPAQGFHGSGSTVTDTQGRTYIDGSGGPAVYCLGYGHPEVTEAIKRQLDRVMHGYRYTFTSDPLEELTELVARACGADLDSMVFVSGGSEAVESCLKLALQYHSARGEPGRRRFIARQRSWHGNTLGALSISGFRERRAPFEGALVEASHLSPVNAYRPPAGVDPSDLAAFGAAELEREIVRLGAGRVAAFVFEPVVGAAGGVVPAPPGYARLVREVCDRHGVLMIADEVMCGSGRCGTFRALQHEDVVPDIMAIAKGLGGGYLPLGAAIYGHRVRDAVALHGGPMTGHTFAGHTTACAAGVAVQRVIARDGLVERVRDNGPRFSALVREALAGVAEVGDVRGRGYFWGVELVADPATKAPFAPDVQLHLRIRQAAFDNGLICYPCNGNVDGWAGDTVILAPPYNASDEDLAFIADRLGRSIREVLATLPAEARRPFAGC